MPSSPSYMPSRGRTSIHFISCSFEPSTFFMHHYPQVWSWLHRTSLKFIVTFHCSNNSFRLSAAAPPYLVHFLFFLILRPGIRYSRQKPSSTTSFPPHLSIAPNCNRWASTTSICRYSIYAICADEVGCRVVHILCWWYSFHRIPHIDTCVIFSAITVDAAGLTVSEPACCWTVENYVWPYNPCRYGLPMN